MATPTTITVFDREDTPVSHSFLPGRKDGTVQYFYESDGVKIGDKTITISQRETNNKYRPRMLLKIPVVVNETINGVTSPKVVREAIADVSFTFSSDSSEQERENAVGILANTLSDAQTEVNKVLTKLEYWG